MFDEQSFSSGSFSPSSWSLSSVVETVVGLFRRVTLRSDGIDSLPLPPTSDRKVRQKSASRKVGLRTK